MPVIADERQFAQLVKQLAEMIRTDVPVAEDTFAIVGVRRRGDDLARRLASILKPAHFGLLDITLYRDDLSEIATQPQVRTTEIPFDVDGKHIVLVDDVLMSGRSVRAALNLLSDLGRPKRVWLAVLVDRGGRELPIKADMVALDLSAELSSRQWVQVRIKPTDEDDAIAVPPSKADLEVAP